MNRPIALDGHAVEHLSSDFEPWLSCEDCFAQADVVIEDLALRAGRLEGPFRAHLRGCPACLDEARALLALLADDHGLDAEALLERFDRSVALVGP